MTSETAPAPLRRIIGALERMPLRSRLLAIIFVLLTIAMLLTSTISAGLLSRDLHNRVDDELRAAAAPVARQGLEDLQPDAGQRVPSAYAVIFQPGNGTTRAWWPEGMASKPALPRITANDVRLQGSQPFTVPAEDGHGEWRMIAGTISGGPGIFIVGVPLEATDATVKRLFIVTGLIGMVIALASVIIGVFAIQRAFRPLRQIEDTAAAIAGGDLSRRIPHRDSGDEVASLAESLNVMLSQIEGSFARSEASEMHMRQFVADASHELRTPLATVRGYSELYRQGAVSTKADLDSAMSRIESESARMTNLVDDLLLLARLDSQRPMEKSEVDLVVIAGDAVQDARARDRDRHISLIPLDEDLVTTPVTGDDSRLRQVMVNLVNNAMMHTPPGTPVEVAVGLAHDPDGASNANHRGSSPPHAIVEVRDHGHGIPPQQAARVFERFYREDKARSRQKGGSGLGLAIVATIVAQHGGTVRVDQTPGGGATFRVTLPAANSQSAHSPHRG